MIPRWIAAMGVQVSRLDHAHTALEGLKALEYKLSGPEHTAVRHAVSYLEDEVKMKSVSLGTTLLKNNVFPTEMLIKAAQGFVDSHTPADVAMEVERDGRRW